jgi:glutaredoxin
MTTTGLWRTFRLVRMVAASTVVALAGASAQAQTVYRIVGADGKVTFSDKPPVTVDQGKVVGTGVGASGAASNTGLPFELRKVASKYPVTLYTGSKCSPCDAARSFLIARGIPFTERTVTTNEDTEALQRISGEPSLPFITVGGQRIGGFSDADLTQNLDAAGYPKTSALPAGYKNAAPTPLVAVQKPAEPAPKPEAKPAPVAPPPPAKNPDNPTGIVF